MSTILTLPQTETFDPANEAHRAAYVVFLNTGKWPLKFDLEFPFTSLPSMAMFKLAAFVCGATAHVAPLFNKANLIPTESAIAVNDAQGQKAA